MHCQNTPQGWSGRISSFRLQTNFGQFRHQTNFRQSLDIKLTFSGSKSILSKLSVPRTKTERCAMPSRPYCSKVILSQLTCVLHTVLREHHQTSSKVSAIAITHEHNQQIWQWPPIIGFVLFSTVLGIDLRRDDRRTYIQARSARMPFRIANKPIFPYYAAQMPDHRARASIKS